MAPRSPQQKSRRDYKQDAGRRRGDQKINYLSRVSSLFAGLGTAFLSLPSTEKNFTPTPREIKVTMDTQIGGTHIEKFHQLAGPDGWEFTVLNGQQT